MDFVLFDHNLKKHILLVSCMTNIQWIVYFEGQQCTISDYNLASLRTLTRGVRKGGLYMLLVDPMELVHSNEGGLLALRHM